MASPSPSTLPSTSVSDLIIGGKYKVIRKIGPASFGGIYLAINMTDGEEVAVKTEYMKAATKAGHPELLHENSMHKILKGGIGIPRIRWFGHEDGYNIMVMDLLGHSLEELFNLCSRRFSMKTLLVVAEQMIKRIEYIHTKGIIHKCLSPKEFRIAIDPNGNKLYLTNFGKSKKFRGKESGQHLPYNDECQAEMFKAKYASINAHKGIEQSRRDDLESLGYILMYFNRGSLPWQGLNAATKIQKLEMIGERKMATPVQVLCEGYPTEFALYLNYCRSLRFDETPNYVYLRHLFRTLFRTRHYHLSEFTFDWATLEQEKDQVNVSGTACSNPNCL